VVEHRFADPAVVPVQPLGQHEGAVDGRAVGPGPAQRGQLQLEPPAQARLAVDLGDRVQREGSQVRGR
jgi:hypothetical protein